MYMDYAATAPLTKQALDTYQEAAAQFYGNASSPHDAGTKAALLLEHSRGRIAKKAGVSPDGIVFTGSGTEANVLGILSLARAGKKRHIITSQAEHTSVHAAMAFLAEEGFRITKLPLTPEGIVSVQAVREAITADTALLSIQHVNSEIGTIQPIAAIGAEAKQHGILFHTDCVQSFGKLPLDAIEADAMSFSAHKIGGPKGCGAVYLSPFQKKKPLFPGLTHEKGLRGGTVDVPAVAAFAKASETVYSLDRMWSLRRLLKRLLAGSAFQWMEGPDHMQYPGVVGLFIPGMEGQLVMLSLNAKGIYISTGSACDAAAATGMKAALAMGRTMEEARQFFRVSLGPETTEDDIAILAEALLDVAKQAIVV